MNGRHTIGKICAITLVSLLLTTGIVSAIRNPEVSKQVSKLMKLVVSDDENMTGHPSDENHTKPLENITGNSTRPHENVTGPVIGNMIGNETGGNQNETGPIGNMTGNETSIPGNENVTRPLENITGNQASPQGNETGPVGNETGNETGGNHNETGPAGNWTGNTTYHPADANYDGRITIDELTSYAAVYGKNDPYLQSATDIWRHGEYYGWQEETYLWSPYHPADTNRDFTITIDEVTAYASLHGQNDQDVQSATYLWQHGESYYYDSSSQLWSLV